MYNWIIIKSKLIKNSKINCMLKLYVAKTFWVDIPFLPMYDAWLWKIIETLIYTSSITPMQSYR